MLITAISVTATCSALLQLFQSRRTSCMGENPLLDSARLTRGLARRTEAAIGRGCGGAMKKRGFLGAAPRPILGRERLGAGVGRIPRSLAIVAAPAAHAAAAT